jgi:hypothetical protein
MKKVVFGFAILVVFSLLFGCSDETTPPPTTPEGIYDGIGVWLVDETNATNWGSANYEGQPTPTAIGHLSGSISALSTSFSVQLKDPYDYSESGLGWWNINSQDTNWTAASGDYYVFLVPMYWASGVSGQGNMEWHFGEGKVSASGGNESKLTITSNNPTLNLTNFQNWSDL